MKRAQFQILGAWAASSLLSCGGITQPGGAGGAAGGQTSPSAGAPSTGGGNANANQPCETECLRQVFTGSVASCKLCHGNVAQLAGLNLESPNVTSRLKDVPATHGELLDPMAQAACPVGDTLIDTTFPENSWLLKKIRGQQGACGTAMPQTPPVLTPSAVACLETYVYCVAAE